MVFDILLLIQILDMDGLVLWTMTCHVFVIFKAPVINKIKGMFLVTSRKRPPYAHNVKLMSENEDKK